MATGRLTALLAGALGLLAGCQRSESVKPGASEASRRAGAAADRLSYRIEPLLVQQSQAYPEAAGGMFVSLADFEDVPGGRRGFRQVGHFVIRPGRPGGKCRFAVNVTRTGVGALEVALPPGSELEFTIPHCRDFTDYTLLSLAVHSRTVRDDLRVAVASDGASWRSGRKLVRPGWNNILVDIRRLRDVKGLDVTSVRSLRLGFADAAGPVWFHLDDVLLIDNTRTIRPTPAGVVLSKSGLDYRLKLPGQPREIALRQCPDGLWRFEGPAARIRLAGPGQELPTSGEHLELMGARRVGQVGVLEHNRIRLRLANTWYFPKRAGEWASLAVRTIRWEHTFYGDGRWVAQGMLNNAGGREISSVGLFVPVPAAWAGGRVADHYVLTDFAGEVGRWQYLVAPSGPMGKTISQNYLRPGRLRPGIVAGGLFASGDAGRDGFDESEGCFFLGAKAGHCRFTVVPPPEGLWNPVFLVSGRWSGRIDVCSEGLAIRSAVRRADGSVVFVLPGLVRRPTAVEVAGKAPPLATD